MKLLVLISLFYCVHSLELKDEVQQLKEQNALLKQGLQAFEKRLSELEQKCDRPKHEDIRAIRQAAAPEVGFLATVLPDLHHLHVNTPIIYDSVITNIGNNYDPTTGEFSCQYPGTYLFNFNVMSAESNYVEAALTVNGAHVIYALSDHQNGDTAWDIGTSNVIIQLKEGDVVTVTIHWPQGENTLHGNKFNTFSGYLLRHA